MIGEKLGPYTILETIGSGSMGMVYRAEAPNGRQVALKLVRAQVLYTRERREQFLLNALAASEIRHRGICPILEIGDDNNDFFIIMPFLSGKTLEKYLDRKPLPWQTALDIALEAGAAIEAIHNAHAVHRGIRPGHVWILDDREPGVMLSDCCIGRSTEISRSEGRRLSASNRPSPRPLPLGTCAYMSPEQIRGEPLDHRTDVFSFGVVLFEMLSGRHPFGASHSPALIKSILEEKPLSVNASPSAVYLKLESILHQALAKDREERYPGMRVMLDEIKAVREGTCIQSAPTWMPGGIRKWFYSKFRRLL